MSVQALCDIFGHRIISSDIWPVRSPDLNSCDFFFWACLRTQFTAVNLKRKGNANIPAEQLQRVN
jgi:hypothetical protein